MPTFEAPAPRLRLMSLQAARAVAAMMVVLVHVATFVSDVPGLWVHPAIHRNLEGMVLGVELFFVLSGMVILSAHWDDLGHPSRIPAFLWKRFRRIYPLYWLVLILTLFRQLSAPGPGAEYQRNPFVILSSFLLIHIHSIETNMVVGWTLFHEILFYAVFSLLLLNRRFGIGVFAVWLAASVFFFHPNAANAYWAALFSPLHLLFACGVLAGLLLRKRRISHPLPVLLLGSAIFVSSVCLLPHLLPFTLEIDLIAGTGAALLLTALVELERRQHFTVPRWLCFLGDASYSLYLIHFMVVSTAARAFFRIDSHLHLPIAFWMLALFASAIAAGCLTYLWVERPILKWLGKINRPAIQAA